MRIGSQKDAQLEARSSELEARQIWGQAPKSYCFMTGVDPHVRSTPSRRQLTLVLFSLLSDWFSLQLLSVSVLLPPSRV